MGRWLLPQIFETLTQSPGHLIHSPLCPQRWADFGNFSEPHFSHLISGGRDCFLVKLLCGFNRMMTEISTNHLNSQMDCFSWKINIRDHVKHRTTHKVSDLRKKSNPNLSLSTVTEQAIRGHYKEGVSYLRCQTP